MALAHNCSRWDNSPRYPLEPLEGLAQLVADEPDSIRGGQASGGFTRAMLARMLDVDPTYISRWRRAGLTWATADEVAIRLGLHPGEVWPEWWSLSG